MENYWDYRVGKYNLQRDVWLDQVSALSPADLTILEILMLKLEVNGAKR